MESLTKSFKSRMLENKAEVAELVDALDSGFCSPELQVIPSKPIKLTISAPYAIPNKIVKIVNHDETRG